MRNESDQSSCKSSQGAGGKGKYATYKQRFGGFRELYFMLKRNSSDK